MGFSEYLASREFLIYIGQPIITYILLLAIFQGSFAIFYLINRKASQYIYFFRFVCINTGLYIIGFIFLMWFHFQIYNEVLIEYPLYMHSIIPADSSRFAVPLWIESEKLYFWAMISSIFMLTIRSRKEIASFSGVILSIFSAIIYFFSNPFKDPLPVVHGEIVSWYSNIGQGDGSIYQIAGMLYGRITYYYNSAYMWIHPPTVFIAYALLIITFAACIFMLIRHDSLYEETAYMYAKPGYILLTTGMLIGYPWAIEAWKDSSWWWDPKISGSIMMWALYSAYLHARIYVNRGKMWRTTAVLGIVGFVSLIFTYLLTYLIPGIHSVVQT
jgi:cytochrome c biogenesis factor